jgi:hypothetical protein
VPPPPPPQPMTVSDASATPGIQRVQLMPCMPVPPW